MKPKSLTRSLAFRHQNNFLVKIFFPLVAQENNTLLVCHALDRVYFLSSCAMCLKASDTRRDFGFTLLEVLVVVAIFGVIACVALSTDMTSFRRYSFRDERDTLVGVVQKARGEAMNGVCFGIGCTAGVSHGVHFDTNKYTLFQGDTYNATDTENEIVTVNPAIIISGASNVVFEKNSGDASTTPTGVWNIVFSDTSGHVSTTTVNSVGQISWTN